MSDRAVDSFYLPSRVYQLALKWLKSLMSVGRSPEQVARKFCELVRSDGEIVRTARPEDLAVLREWVDEVGPSGVVKLMRPILEAAGSSSKEPRSLPKATDNQIKIILDSQKEADVDFSRFLSQLTSWEADVIIKGLILISEVRRQTGGRNISLKDVREAIRRQLADRKQDG